MLHTASINPIPNIKHNKKNIGIIANIEVKWNDAPVINITPNKITKDIKKFTNS